MTLFDNIFQASTDTSGVGYIWRRFFGECACACVSLEYSISFETLCTLTDRKSILKEYNLVEIDREKEYIFNVFKGNFI